ncbi:PepSY-associated TM helix domain-containing protein [Novosphingobium olei]|uniref:PepSY domain-containing protein n=1 Tax=Novosphingobium olei TaxID=2728851 RepID=A0A7Y0GC32_9SPHN|nr:PepSY-associated TM helix domain-containing protein [Novosphingobium olei]NML95753.1 PepSY domain-containing protein [Novosphingobium olei]
MASTAFHEGGRAKHIFRRVHLCMGLTLGLLWALQGLTGAILVFHRELDRSALPSPQRSMPLSLDVLLGAAHLPVATRPESIGRVDHDPSIFVINYTGPDGRKRGHLIDTATGAKLGERDWRPTSPFEGSATRWIYDLHHRLLLGEMGGILLGASGLFLLASALIGVWLAWPRRKAWRAIFDFRRWRSTAQRLYGWHRLVGLCAAVSLVLLAITGATMGFGKQLRSFSESHLPYRPPYAVQPGLLPRHIVTANQALAAAQVRLPHAAFVSLILPSPALPAYQVRLRQPGEWRIWSGTSMITVDPVDGRVLDVYDAERAPLTNRLLESAFAFHSGEAAGFAGRIVTFLTGLGLTAMYMTGVSIWFSRHRRRRGQGASQLSHDKPGRRAV